MPLKLEQTRATFERAQKVMPYGVSSNFRYWGDDTPIVSRAEGAYIWDMDDNRYIDYRLAFGPIILGHADARVTAAVMAQLNKGMLYAHTHPLEIEVAERMIKMCPGVEMVRYANSGTEATMHALRIARAYTNREKVIKFEGNYHGFHDYVLFSTAMTSLGSVGSRYSPLAAQNSSGIPEHLRSLLISLVYNDMDRLEKTVKAKWGEIAAIIVEPIAGNMAGVTPVPGFLELIRKLCTDYGIVMIMDEVKTGFRIAKGGATEFFGVKGDLMTYAKSIANGHPLAAIGGSKEVMGVIEPGRMAHGGTYCGNGVGTAAAVATLDILQNTDALEVVKARGQQLMDGLAQVFTEAGIPHDIQGHPAMFGIMPGQTGQPRNYREAMMTDLPFFEEMAAALRERGVELELDWREPLFLSAAHTAADIDETLNAFRDTLKGVKRKH
jgi:glutamate-1-semialdehyde 2,1-aminomutase